MLQLPLAAHATLGAELGYSDFSSVCVVVLGCCAVVPFYCCDILLFCLVAILLLFASNMCHVICLFLPPPLPLQPFSWWVPSSTWQSWQPRRESRTHILQPLSSLLFLWAWICYGSSSVAPVATHSLLGVIVPAGRSAVHVASAVRSKLKGEEHVRGGKETRSNRSWVL